MKKKKRPYKRHLRSLVRFAVNYFSKPGTVARAQLNVFAKKINSYPVLLDGLSAAGIPFTDIELMLIKFFDEI